MKRKELAAIAAVIDYMKTQEESQAAMSEDVAGISAPSSAVMGNVWGLNGRQSQMLDRRMMQMKVFHRR